MHRPPLAARRLVPGALALAAVAAAVLTACGGGGSAGGGAGTYASGPITGFGSIVVGGMHFDESAARITDEDGGSPGALALGMVAEIHASAVSDDASGKPRATAQSVVIVSLLVGPLAGVAADGHSAVVLGQTVRIDADTAVDGLLKDGLAHHVGEPVRIFGLLDVASGSYTATRIVPAPNPPAYRLRGVVSAYDASAKTLAIGSASVDLSQLPAGALPSDLHVGSLVKLRLATTQVSGRWVALEVQDVRPAPGDHEAAEVEGRITSFTSTTSFSVDGLPVDASAATFPDGTGGLAQGARVEVHGSIVGGVLVATRVNVESSQAVHERGFEVEGSVASIDAAASSFVVHGVTVHVDATQTVFSGGSLATLAVGTRVEVRGVLSADGTTLEATSVRLED